MNYGPLIFLGAFFALATSWFSFVLKPQFQIGQLQATNSVPGNMTYPLGRAGLASQGLEVYRARRAIASKCGKPEQSAIWFSPRRELINRLRSTPCARFCRPPRTTKSGVC